MSIVGLPKCDMSVIWFSGSMYCLDVECCGVGVGFVVCVFGLMFGFDG